jgi:Fe-S oxidoreductase
MKSQDVRIKDMSSKEEQITHLDPKKFPKLPHPYEDWDDGEMQQLTDDQKTRIEHGLDGVSAIGLIKPESEEEKEKQVVAFLEGLAKLFTKENNWTFLQQLMLSMENCVKCQTCNDACPVYTESGGEEIYRPTFRAETLRAIVNKYLKPGGKILPKFRGNDVDLTWDTMARLAELSYRCTLCRRCAQTCPIGVDNGMINREIRKLFSQELGITVMELHAGGTVKQLKTGSSTGMNPTALQDIIEFAEEDIEEKTGLKIKIPFDKEGADYLVMHNAGEFLSWPENLQAFAILFEIAGVNWTMSSDMLGYDSVNYGLFYDDVMFARIALKQATIAKELKVKSVLQGECGHAHKAFMPIADRIFVGELNIPRESCFPVFEDLVCNGKIKLDPSRNNFPVTLHDPCNVSRNMGIIMPQRRVLNAICPQFREMTPHGVTNYCCGGGSGFAIMQGSNFPDWRNKISGRKKFGQCLNAFQDVIEPGTKKYICAPCSNCKGQFRDLLGHYDAWEQTGMHYGGLVELIVNAMVDVKEGFLEWPDDDM